VGAGSSLWRLQRAAFVLWSWLLVIAIKADAQTNIANVRPVTLQQCIKLALEKNLDVQIVLRNPEVARFNLGASKGVHYDPLLTFEAKREYWDVPANFNNAKINIENPYEQTLDTLAAGLRGRLTPGLSYDFSLSSVDDKAFTDFSGIGTANRHTNNFEAFANLNFSQSLLKDFWIDAGRMLIQVNKKNLKISEQELRLQVMTTVLAVQKAYFDLIYAKEKEKLAIRAVSLAKELLDWDRKLVESSQAPPLTEKLAESQVERAEASLLLAQDELESQRNELRSLLADDLITAGDEILEPTDPLSAAVWTGSRTESLQNAMTLRPELQIAKAEVEKQGIVLRYHRNQLFPALDIVGSYGGLAVEPDSRGDTLSTLGDLEHPVYSGGIVLRVPLSNTASRNQYRASRALKEQALLRLKKLEQVIFLEVTELVGMLERLQKRISATRKAREYAEAAWRAEQELLTAGKSRTVLVSEYERNLFEAHAAEVNALSDYNKALARLAFSDGTALDRNQIVIESESGPVQWPEANALLLERPAQRN
jgi:outer membrane protein TolC